MTMDEIECDRCHEVKHFSEYSRSQRKMEDPMCQRCVAWGETQHHNVIPAPLGTGHVSIEESNGEVWSGMVYRTDEDYCRPQASISGREAIGLEGQGDITDEALQAMTSRTSGLVASDTQSVASGSTARTAISALPPHLARKVATSQASSDTGGSNVGSNISSLPPHLQGRMSASSTSTDRSPSSSSQLPPDLRKHATSSPSTVSVSTATTMKVAKEEARQKRTTNFNAWDASGNKVVKTHTPSTAASSETGPSSTAAPSSHKATSPTPVDASHRSDFPKAHNAERAHRQVENNPIPPPGVKVKKRSFPQAKPAAPDSEFKRWPEPTWD